ncbi:phosphatidate cytidylyltransferase [Cryobacterium tepidiphilum]|uniref:Phosphatidate cytidylyltransferase n=1 Tax=Cryobacterium tepidiphilum TaxID=2486026 RepID=A0A3M8KYW0_9MICO|nr:phosphatidate cytidylyltransferase [Cryobacterium tepidiphilum]RNE58477.1 phosphatidate cytidylyltransferase [Cryobacterium tepidiphilum]
MTHDPGQERPPRRSNRTDLRAQVRATRADFERQVQSTRADIERQVQVTRAQFEATSERIEARTGRNLIGAILIGLLLGVAMLSSLIFIKELFMVLAVLIAGFTALELAEALRRTGRTIPRIPVGVAAVAIVPLAFYGGATGQVLGVFGGIALIMVSRLALMVLPGQRMPRREVLRDLGAAFLIEVYVVLLASFAVLLTTQDGGQWWTLAFLILVILADVGAYASGLSFGKHPMAPTISPKKTWEGFAGAALVCLVAGVLLALFMLHQPFWFGLVFGAVILVTATFGDLAESLIKRDLGIKDMSSWLPGHGGFLDRLDSILPSAAAAYALYVIFA